MTARVAWIALTPVKATRLHLVEEAELLESGVRGDRRFFVISDRNRLVNAKGFGSLQLVDADYDEDADALTMRVDDSVIAGEIARGEEVETSFHRRPRSARIVNGPWAAALSDLVGERVHLVEPTWPALDRGRSAAATILGTGSLSQLAAQLGVDAVDGRRFRMNFGVEGLEAHGEDGWHGRRVRIGDAVVIPQGNVGRCAVTTQNPETGRADLDTLNALAGYRLAVETTEPLPFGIHAAVAEPGHVRVGDPVEPTS